MVPALSHVEVALQVGVTMRVRLDGRDADALREIDRVVRFGLRSHPENGGQQVLRAGQLPERDADLVAGVELHVKAKQRLDRADRARQILAGVLRFENGGVGIKDTYQTTGPGALDDGLRPKRGGDEHTHREKTGNREA